MLQLKTAIVKMNQKVYRNEFTIFYLILFVLDECVVKL